MKPRIAIIDYGMGNLHSVAKSIAKAGGSVVVTTSHRAIREAAGVVLPGVGAFGAAIGRLAADRLLDPIARALAGDRPFLGICLGLQLLFERSEESPRERGLGFLKGAVVRFQIPRRRHFKVPHMGWNTIKPGPAGRTPYLRGVSRTDYFYFVHSFYPAPDDSQYVASRTHYGSAFCSSVAKANLFACQFHPEKSGEQGRRVLTNFVREVARCS